VTAGENVGLEGGNVLASTFTKDASPAREGVLGSAAQGGSSGVANSASAGLHDPEVKGDSGGKEESPSQGQDHDRSHAHGVADSSTGGGYSPSAAVDAFFTDLGKKGRSLWSRFPGF
jgi:hypothetical protein